MSATVSNFGEARRKKRSEEVPGSNFRCPDCGGQKFVATVFVAKVRGSVEPGDVVGYAHPLRCPNCGWVQS